jgi:hypothetical protein
MGVSKINCLATRVLLLLPLLLLLPCKTASKVYLSCTRGRQPLAQAQPLQRAAPTSRDKFDEGGGGAGSLAHFHHRFHRYVSPPVHLGGGIT